MKEMFTLPALSNNDCVMRTNWLSLPNTILLLTAFVCVAAGGCSAEQYQRSADREVRGILAAKEEQVEGNPEPFDLARRTITVEEVGVAREIEDLRRAPAPQPFFEPLNLDQPDEPDEPSKPGAPEAKPKAAADAGGTMSRP